ncbi:MAG: GNAT family N-acetyltransferase [Caldilineaceae bacterium]|nr:GNAT family N-acetyltransferase [Caldilineaceae bacterium]
MQSKLGHLQLRSLTRAEIAQIGQIDRSEVIHHIYVQANGQLVRQPAYFAVKGWQPASLAAIIADALACFDRGGWCMGVFASETLAGIATLDHQWIGAKQDQLQLQLLHVSHPYRHLGVGKQLFAQARAAAQAQGARWLYISATPSENTVHFYQRQGCVLADPPDPALLALEPEDIHFVCAV